MFQSGFKGFDVGDHREAECKRIFFGELFVVLVTLFEESQEYDFVNIVEISNYQCCYVNPPFCIVLN